MRLYLTTRYFADDFRRLTGLDPVDDTAFEARADEEPNVMDPATVIGVHWGGAAR